MGILDNLRSKDPLDAKIAQLERLSSQKKEDASLKNSLGDLYLKKGNHEKASEYYTGALQILTKQKQDTKAIAIIKKVIPHNLIDTNVMEALIASFLKKGMKTESIELLSLVAREQMNRNPAQARDTYKKILKIDPDNKEAHTFLDKEGERLDSKPVVSDTLAGDKWQRVDTRATATSASLNREQQETETYSVKEKFLAVAKEKGYLENVLAQQNELIKKIDKDKSELVLKLKQSASDNKKLKQKLADLDAIRGKEIEELKGQIHTKLPKEEYTLKEKFRSLEKEKDVLKLQLSSALTELDTAKKVRMGTDNISFSEQVVAYESQINDLKNDIEDLTSSMEEKVRELEDIKERNGEVLQKEESYTQEIANLKAEMVQKDRLIDNKAKEYEKHYAELLAYHKDSFSALEKERDTLRDELTALKAEKTGVNDVLQEKEAGYAGEIDELKKDIDELTVSMEEKVRESEEMREREQHLVSREKELTDELGGMTDELHQQQERFSALEQERDALWDELTALKAEKTGVDDVLQEKEAGYAGEIDELKKDIDELTISMEEKVWESEKMREREQHLVSREKELTEKITALEREVSEKVTFLEQERAKEMSGLEERLSEKETALEQTAAEHKQKYDELLLYHHERFSALEQERNNLRDELTRKEEMLNDSAAAYKNATEELEKRIRESETENQRLHDSVSELKGEVGQSSRSRKIIEDQMIHVRDDMSKREQHVKERITELTAELVQKEELFVETVEAHECEKRKLQSTINDFETAVKRHENETKTLNIGLAGMKSQADEYLKMYQEVDNQRKELDERLAEALKNMYELKNENERQLSVISSKEQELLNLQQEFNLEVHALNEKIERMKSASDKQSEISAEKAKEISQMAQEKMDLLERISALEGTFDRVRKDKDQEIVKMRDQLGTSFMKISELENSLKVSLNANIDLRKKLEAKPESVYIEEEKTAEPLQAKPEPKPEPEPAPRPEIRDLIVYHEKKNWLSYINYAFLFVLLIISLLILYRTFVFTSQPQRPSQLSALYDLTYNEIFTLLTREQSTDYMKVQATMISELLMRRENAGRILSQFDFKRYYYLKININALQGSLSQQFIDNPRDGILITDGAQEVRPDQGIALEEVKTFYKKDEPVSLSFMYVIPKDRTVSAMKKLEIVLRDRGEAVRMNWDIQKLKADKVIR